LEDGNWRFEARGLKLEVGRWKLRFEARGLKLDT
jgi:hypothetical protein